MSFEPPVSMSSGGLDIRTILTVSIRYFLFWLAPVLIVTFAGQPGVICMTPMAWLLALWVGLQIASRTRSIATSQRVIEGAFGGALLGFLQGILFWAITQYMGDIQPDERVNSAVLYAIMLGGGTLAGAGLAAIMALRGSKMRGTAA